MSEQGSIARQGIRYLVVGGLAAVIDVGVFAFLYPDFVAQLWVGATLSFLVAAAFNYTVSSLYVFGIGNLFVRRGALFLMVASLGLLINVSFTAAFAAGMGADPGLAKCLGIGMTVLFNFTANRQLVFRHETRT